MRKIDISDGMRNFLIIWIGEFISNIGTGMTTFAASIYVYNLSGAVTSVSLVIFAAFSPSILLSPFSGIIADRYDRRVLMMIGDGFSIIGLVLILTFFYLDRLTVTVIVMGIFISSMFYSLLEPAYKASVSDLLSYEDYSKASSLLQLGNAGKLILSPVLAGLLLAVSDLGTVITFDIFTVFITLTTIFMIKNRMKVNRDGCPSTQNYSFKEFLGVFLKKRGLVLLVYIITCVTFFTGVIQTLYTPMLLSMTEERMVGVIQSFSALGLLFMSFLLSLFSVKNKLVSMIILGLISFGVFIILLGSFSNIWLVCISGFFMFASLPFINVGIEVLIRENINSENQGKIWGIIGFLSQLGYVIAYLISGVLSDFVMKPLLTGKSQYSQFFSKYFGTGPGREMGLLFVVSGVMIIASGLFISVQSDIWKMERANDKENNKE